MPEVTAVHRTYVGIGERLGRRPELPRRDRSVVIVPVADLSRLTVEALTAASLGDEVRTVTVCRSGPVDRAQTYAPERAWACWEPGLPLIRLTSGPPDRGVRE